MQSSNKKFETDVSIDSGWWYADTNQSCKAMLQRRFLKRQKSKSLRRESKRVLREEKW